MEQNYLQYRLNKKVNQKQVTVIDKYRITLLGNKMLRIESSPNYHFEDQLTTFAINREFADVQATISRENELVTITTDYYSLSFNINLGMDSVKAKLTNQDQALRIKEHNKANLLGTYRTLDMANGKINLENGIFSKTGVAYLDDTDSLLFNDDGFMEERIKPKNYTDLYFFFFGDNFYEGLKEFAKLSGKTPLIPRYVLGNWWSRYYEYTEESLKAVIEEFKHHELPLSICVIDMDWHLTNVLDERGGWTGYSWNLDNFPNPKRMIDYLHKNHLKTCLNLHPADGIRHFEDNYEVLASALNIDPATKKRIPFDIFNPLFAKNYFEKILHPHQEIGVDFWWVDWQQGLKTEMSNLDPLFQLNHLHFLDLEQNNTRGLTFSRYPGKGGHRYPIGFSGDALITWDSLAFQPYFTSTASNIAFTWWSHDIGGHCGGKDEDELFIRWMQLGVFQPINRLHSTKNEFIIRAPFARNNPLVLENAKKYLTFRQKLIPYLYTAAYQNYQNEIPLIRPLYYDYPQLKEAYEYQNEYFFGPSILVNPVVTPLDSYLKVALTKTYLPKGIYYDLFSYQKYSKNGKLKFYHDINKQPIFVKAGSIIPLAKLNPLNLSSNPKVLEVLIFPNQDSNYTLYEDDGVSNDYKQNHAYFTHFDLKYSKNKLTLTISSKGDNSLIPLSRELHLKFVNIKKNVIITTSACKVIETIYDEKDKLYLVKVENPQQEAFISISCKDTIEVNRRNEFLYQNLFNFIFGLNELVDNKDEVQHHILNNLHLSKKELVNLVKTKVTRLPRKVKQIMIDIINQSE